MAARLTDWESKLLWVLIYRSNVGLSGRWNTVPQLRFDRLLSPTISDMFVHRTYRALAERGLVERAVKGRVQYEITSEGRRYYDAAWGVIK